METATDNKPSYVRPEDVAFVSKVLEVASAAVRRWGADNAAFSPRGGYHRPKQSIRRT